MVDDLQHLGPRAVVLGQREHAARGLAPLAEDLDVGVPEAVDRLELVADEEEVLGREQVDQLALEPVRVLELVHEHRAEAPALPLADRRVVAEQVAGGQLEVLEVERRLARLRRRVRVGEAPQQLLEQGAVARGELVEGGLLDRTPGLLVGREALRWPPRARELGEVEQPLGVRRSLEELERPRAARPRRACVAARPCRRRGTARPRGAPRSAPRGPAAPTPRARARARPSGASRRRPSASAAARARRRSRAGASAPASPAAQNSSSADSNASPASTRDWFSSRTRKLGSTPASNGCAFSSRWQKPWMVEIQAPSSSRARSCAAELARGARGSGRAARRPRARCT